MNLPAAETKALALPSVDEQIERYKHAADAERANQLSPGQTAYEEDVRRRPRYDDGSPRVTWDKLDDCCKWSWQRNPTPRNWR